MDKLCSQTSINLSNASSRLPSKWNLPISKSKPRFKSTCHHTLVVFNSKVTQRIYQQNKIQWNWWDWEWKESAFQIHRTLTRTKGSLVKDTSHRKCVRGLNSSLRTKEQFLTWCIQNFWSFNPAFTSVFQVGILAILETKDKLFVRTLVRWRKSWFLQTIHQKNLWISHWRETKEILLFQVCLDLQSSCWSTESILQSSKK